MNDIEKKWTSYAKQLFKKDMPKGIMDSYRAIFYAGVMAAVEIMDERGSKAKVADKLTAAIAQYAEEALAKRPEKLARKKSSAGKCCKRDHNRDGNCDIHAAPGVLRSDEYLMD